MATDCWCVLTFVSGSPALLVRVKLSEQEARLLRDELTLVLREEGPSLHNGILFPARLETGRLSDEKPHED